MPKSKHTLLQQVVHEEEYVAFLKKRLDSEHFRASATPEEVEKTQVKYERAKFRLKTLKMDMK